MKLFGIEVETVPLFRNVVEPKTWKRKLSEEERKRLGLEHLEGRFDYVLEECRRLGLRERDKGKLKVYWDRLILADKNMLYKFLQCVEKPPKTILSVGCCDEEFCNIFSLIGYEIWGIDWRPWNGLPARFKFVQGDFITTTKIQEGYFDYVTDFSAVHHIGLGAWGDPLYDNGDAKAMEKIHRLLKQGGECHVFTMGIRLKEPPEGLKIKNRKIYSSISNKPLQWSYTIDEFKKYIIQKFKLKFFVGLGVWWSGAFYDFLEERLKETGGLGGYLALKKVE